MPKENPKKKGYYATTFNKKWLYAEEFKGKYQMFYFLFLFFDLLDSSVKR